MNDDLDIGREAIVAGLEMAQAFLPPPADDDDGGGLMAAIKGRLRAARHITVTIDGEVAVSVRVSD